MSKQLKLVNDGKPSKRLTRLREESKKLIGLDSALMDDLLVEYDALASMAEELRTMIQEEGVMVEREVGTVNNRRLETLEHNALQPYQRTIGRLGDVAKKISDFAKRSDENVDDDDFDDF